MKLSELMDSVQYISPFGDDIEITSVTNDSRKVEQGSAFVCISGAAADGHKFAEKAAGAGAAVIVCERDLGFSNQIIIEDTRAVYAKMCANWFGNPAKKLKIIGLTGTNGKTTVAFITKHILENCGYKTGLIGTVQNMVGDEIIPTDLTTPDAWELQNLFAKMVKAECTFAVMEVSSHALDQNRVKDIKFAAAAFTNLTQDHLDYHGTMENYFNAKKKLFDMCDSAVINTDDKWGKKLSRLVKCEKITFGCDNNVDLNASEIKFKSDHADFKIKYQTLESETSIPIPGKFSVYNALTAIGAAIAVGIDKDKAVKALETATGVKGRAEVFHTGRNFTVIIDYAHTPDGLVNIITAMREVSKGRIVTLFGCGGDRDPAKRPLMGTAAAELSDFIIITSDNPRTENPEKIIEDILPGVADFNTPKIIIENRREAIRYAITHAKKDDVIILAGKGHETYQILGEEVIHFDEREVLGEFLG